MIPCDLVPEGRMPSGRIDKYEELQIRLTQILKGEVQRQIAYVPFSTRDEKLQRKIGAWVNGFVHKRFPKMFITRSTRDGIFIQRRPE